MQLRLKDWLNRAGWLGVLGAALISGSSVLAQELREEVELIISSDDQTSADQTGAAQADDESATETRTITITQAESGEPTAKVRVINVNAEGEVPQGKVRYIVKAEGQPEGEVRYIVTAEAPAEGGQEYKVLALTDEAPAPSPYWIGVMLSPVEEPLRSHLKLEGNQGLFIAEVIPDSPAAAAGLQVHDIVVAVGDKPLTDGMALVAAVNEAQENELTLKIIRAGDTQVVTVKPAKRPQQDVLVADPPGVEGQAAHHEHLKNWFQQVLPGGQGTMRAQFFHPGVMLRAGEPLPDNLSVTITRHGKNPAEISVKQDGKNWTVSEDKLAELPENVRPHVERMMGHGLHGLPYTNLTPPMVAGRQMYVDLVEEGQNPQPVRTRVLRALTGDDAALSKKVDDLARQLDELRALVKELQAKGN